MDKATQASFHHPSGRIPAKVNSRKKLKLHLFLKV